MRSIVTFCKYELMFLKICCELMFLKICFASFFSPIPFNIINLFLINHSYFPISIFAEEWKELSCSFKLGFSQQSSGAAGWKWAFLPAGDWASKKWLSCSWVWKRRSSSRKSRWHTPKIRWAVLASNHYYAKAINGRSWRQVKCFCRCPQ